MKTNFNIKNLAGHKITLQKGQIDIILDALAFYLYTYKYIYPCKKPLTELESTRITQVKDIYCQILDQFKDSSQSIVNKTIINSIENKKKIFFKKVS